MDLAADIPTLMADFGQVVTWGEASFTAVLSDGYAEAYNVSGRYPSLMCRATDVAGITPGAVVIVGGTSYQVRHVAPLRPDLVCTRLDLLLQPGD
jgi:hypothetical protein